MPQNSSEPLLPSLVPMTPKAVQYQQEIYEKNIAAKLDEIEQEILNIFVCGPNKSSNLLTGKRIETINDLRSMDHFTLTGEEEVPNLIQMDLDKGREEKPYNYYEKMMANEADVIVIFCASPGSIAETHEFLSMPQVAPKTIVCIDEKHKGGYIANGAIIEHHNLYGKVIYYKSPDDILECNLKTAVLSMIEQLKLAKAIRKIGY